MSASSILKAAAFGLAGGAAGLVAMRYAMQAASRLMPEGADEEEAGEGSSASDDAASWSLVGMQRREGEAATGTVGRIVYEKALGREPSKELVEKMSNWVHWGYGESAATAYALAARGRGGPGVGAGYGFLLWLIGDELMVPLLGLSEKPTASRLSEHVPPLVAHLAFGTALGATVKALSKALPEEGTAT